MKRTRAQKRFNIVTTVALLSIFMIPFQNCGGAKFDSMNGQAGISSAGSGSATSTKALNEKSAFGHSGLRRLSRTEMLRSVNDIFGVSPQALAATLPPDIRATIYFDNEYSSQTVDQNQIVAFNSFAEAYAATVAAKANVVNLLGGCTPANVNDKNCFVTFAKKVGRRVFRRPLTTVETDAYAAAFMPFAVQDNDFNSAIALLVEMFVQHPEFMYRLEVGETNQLQPNIRELTNYEVATRMSYLIWGSAPDDTLLDEAELGHLKDESYRMAQADRMLASNKAQAQWDDFHAQWMGYSDSDFPAAVKADLFGESNALINKIVFTTDSDWMDIFRSNETYLTPNLATHYGLPAMTTPGWVQYPIERGGGMLSHGTLMSIGAKFGDTSPTRRGYEIYKRLMCGKIPPVPADIDVDAPPGLPTDCKVKSYFMRSNNSCNGCHNITDNIGFGLETIGAFGEYRTTEPNKPYCTIVNEGIVDKATFAGPRELGTILTKNPKVSACAARQLYRFFAGREVEVEDEDTAQALAAQYRQTPQLKSLIKALVKSPAIAYRVEN